MSHGLSRRSGDAWSEVREQVEEVKDTVLGFYLLSWLNFLLFRQKVISGLVGSIPDHLHFLT
jgi:hypothetical protein